jgi:hypothetical protein
LKILIAKWKILFENINRQMEKFCLKIIITNGKNPLKNNNRQMEKILFENINRQMENFSKEIMMKRNYCFFYFRYDNKDSSVDKLPLRAPKCQ